MKVRKKNLCHTCRRRKVQCDGKLPACSQCRNSKRDCEGYPEALFVPFVPMDEAEASHVTTLSPPSQSTSTCKSPPCGSASSPIRSSDAPNYPHRTPGPSNELPSLPSKYPAGLSEPQESISVIMCNYVPTHEPGFGSATTLAQSPQVCGSWVTALPKLILQTTGVFAECLHSALGALALAITAYRTRQNMLHLVATHYEQSLRLLAHSLETTGNIYRNELVAAVMCLALVEVLSPTCPSSWLVHVEGVSKMFQLSSPSLFASNIEHTLFMGFRPVMILKAFIHRKATFFADDAWVRLPFQHHDAAPLQSLLGVAARIPGILEKIDLDIYREATMDAAQERIRELMEAASHLECWHSSYLETAKLPLYWRRTHKKDAATKFDVLWYQDLSTANVVTYFWAFQLVCLENIRRLLYMYPELEQSVHMTAPNTEELQHICVKMGVQIYQSMEYVLQEEFMLYGVSSAGFPLQTACRTLDSDGVDQAILDSLDPTIRARGKI